MWSQYLRTRQKNDRVAIFHQLHPDPVYCSLAEWGSVYRTFSGLTSLLQSLRAQMLWIDDPAEDEQEYARAAERLEHKLNQPTILYLMMAQGCDFNCGYCPIPDLAKRFGETQLRAADAVAGIDLWLEHLRERGEPTLEPFVIFYGGEPLLNKGAIQTSLAYLRSQENRFTRRPQVMIATNGNSVDTDIVAFCKAYDVMVAVGIDGSTESQNLLRKDALGKPTLSRAVSSIELLVSSGIRTFASVSLTPYNISSLGECCRFFEKLGVEKIGFNFLKGKRLAQLVGVEGVTAYYRKASRAMIETAKKLKSSYEYQMEKKILAYTGKDYFPHDCTCYGSQLVIQPDGRISNCPFYKTRLGHVQEVGRDFRIWDQPTVKKWRERMPLYHPGFVSVDAQALCGGGCAWSAEELTGDLFAIDDASVIFTEEVFDELIWSGERKVPRPAS